MRGVFLLSLCAFLVACINPYQPPLSEEALAKQFTSLPEYSKLYIYRSQGLAEQVQIPIWVNGEAVARTSARTFLVLELQPGVHTITSRTKEEDSLTIVTEPGENYYVWQEMKLGITAVRSELHEVEPIVGKAQVGRCRLLKSYL